MNKINKMVWTSKSVLFLLCVIGLLGSSVAYAVNLESFADPLHKKSAEETIADALAKEFKRQDNETYPLAQKAKPDDWFFIDIKPKCNMNIFAPKKIGTRSPVSIEQMPFGRQSYYGVPFDIINPEKNKGESVIALASKRLKTNDYPDKIVIPIKRKVQALYFLMTAYYATREGKQFFLMNFKDGSSQMIKLRGSASSDFTQKEKNEEIQGVRNIGDWYRARNIVNNNNSKYVLVPMNKGAKSDFHALHVIQILNPKPDKEITSITLKSDRNAPMAPFIVAITGVNGVKGVETADGISTSEKKGPIKIVDLPVKMTTTVPVWCVGSYDEKKQPNIMTAAWVGIACSKPPCVTVSLREATYTYNNIMKNKAYTVCVPSAEYVKQTDYYGMVSGRDHNKFEDTGLTPVASKVVNAPYAKEFPLIMECRLIKSVKLGLHTMFVGEIVGIKAHDSVLDEGKINPQKLDSLFFSPADRGYYKLGNKVGTAFSVGKSLIKEK